MTSWPGHKDHIYAMCYDPTTKTLVTGGKEGACFVWNSEGKIQQRWSASLIAVFCKVPFLTFIDRVILMSLILDLIYEIGSK